LARALRANAAYMRIVGDRLASGKRYDAEVVRAKRAAESASGAVFSSLQRMSGDPKNFRNLMSELAAVANGNQRVTRALNLIILEAHPDAPIPEASDLATHRASALEEMARALKDQDPQSDALVRAREQLKSRLEVVPAGPAPSQRSVALAQLERASAEIGAMFLGTEVLAEPGRTS
jgi:uncharacterized membrane protein YccC